MNDKLIDIAQMGVGAAVKAGADQAEAFSQEERVVEVEIEAGAVRYAGVKSDSGVCVRAFRRGGTGVGRGMGADAERMTALARQAADMAAHVDADPDFKSLPEPAAAPGVDGVFDEAAFGLEPATAVEWARRMMDAAREIAPDVILRGGVSVRGGAAAVANSLGVAVIQRYTAVTVEVFAVINRGDKVGSYFDYSRSRTLAGLAAPEDVARATVKKAIGYLDARKMKSGEMPILLGPLAAFEFIRQIADAADAENAQRSRSFLAGRKGAAIASPILSVNDCPLAPGGISSFPFDAEGTPRKTFQLLKDGVLTGWLHNSYTAGKAGEPNTAHAARGGYMTDVGISASNIQTVPGREAEKAIMSGLREALYIDFTSLSPNLSSGDLSAAVDYGWKIEGGEPVYPVENSMIGGNLIDMLGRVEAVSSDFRDDAGNIMPSILIGSMNVAGAAE